MTNKVVTGVNELCNTEVDNRNTRHLQDFLFFSMDALSALTEYLLGAPHDLSQGYFERTKKQKEFIESIFAMTGEAAPTQVVPQSAEAPASTEKDRKEEPWWSVRDKRKELSEYVVFSKKAINGISRCISAFATSKGVPIKIAVPTYSKAKYAFYPAYFFQMVVDKLENDFAWMAKYRRQIVKQGKLPIQEDKQQAPIEWEFHGCLSLESQMEKLSTLFAFDERYQYTMTQKAKIGTALSHITKKLGLKVERAPRSRRRYFPRDAWESFYAEVEADKAFLSSVPRHER